MRFNLLFVLCCMTLVGVSRTKFDKGSECKGILCGQEAGYLRYRGWTPFLSRVRSVFTTSYSSSLILKFTNLKGVTPLSPILIRKIGYSKDLQFVIESNEEHVFVLQDALQADITDLTAKVEQYDLTFYFGCKILEGRNMTINVSPPSESFRPLSLLKQSQQGDCWLLVPSPGSAGAIRNPGSLIFGDRSRAIPEGDIEQTYLTLGNADLGKGSRVGVWDFVDGQNLISATGKRSLVLTIGHAHNTTVYVNNNKKLGSLFFVQHKCGGDCNKDKFTVQADGLTQSDLDCIKRERKCRFNLGREKYNCSNRAQGKRSDKDLSRSDCPAFQVIIQSIFRKLELSSSDNGEGRGLVLPVQCNNYTRHCSTGQCENDECRPHCLVAKNVFGLCSEAD